MAIYTAKQVQDLLRGVGFPEDKIVLMTAICKQESGFNTDALNDGSSTKSVEYSVGLFQINTRVHKTYTVQQLKNPIVNAKEALSVYKKQGFRAWGGYTDGGYKKYLALSQAAYSGNKNVAAVDPNETKVDDTENKLTDNQQVAGKSLAVLAVLGVIALIVLTE